MQRVRRAEDIRCGAGRQSAAFDRMKNKVQHTESAAQASAELASDDVDDRFAAMEKAGEIDRVLAEIKAKRL